MTGELYADRESINPRAFAVRHLVIQEVKFRKAATPTPGAQEQARLDRVARGVDVSYDGSSHTLVVRCESAEIRRVPLDELPLFSRGDTAAPGNRPLADARHWDTALETNRQVVRALVDTMLASLATGAT